MPDSVMHDLPAALVSAAGVARLRELAKLGAGAELVVKGGSLPALIDVLEAAVLLCNGRDTAQGLRRLFDAVQRAEMVPDDRL